MCKDCTDHKEKEIQETAHLWENMSVIAYPLFPQDPRAWVTRLSVLLLSSRVDSSIPMSIFLFLLVVGGWHVQVSPPIGTVSPTAPSIWGPFFALTPYRFSGVVLVKRQRESGWSLTGVMTSSSGIPLFGTPSCSSLVVLAFWALELFLCAVWLLMGRLCVVSS